MTEMVRELKIEELTAVSGGSGERCEIEQFYADAGVPIASKKELDALNDAHNAMFGPIVDATVGGAAVGGVTGGAPGAAGGAALGALGAAAVGVFNGIVSFFSGSGDDDRIAEVTVEEIS